MTVTSSKFFYICIFREVKKNIDIKDNKQTQMKLSVLIRYSIKI